MLKTVGFPSTRTGDQTIVNGNLVIGTAGKGIDFSANPNPAGMTSELLNDYEEGTWTPTVASGGGLLTSYTASGTYTKIGRLVSLNMNILITDNGTGSQSINISGLPFAAAATFAASGVFREVAATGTVGAITVGSTTTMAMNTYNNQYPGGTNYRIIGSITYLV